MYRGKNTRPRWVDAEPGASPALRVLLRHVSSPATELFSQICTVYADTSRVLKQKRNGPKGVYYTQDYCVVILCGATELQAQIRWTENVSLLTQIRFGRVLTFNYTPQGVEKR